MWLRKINPPKILLLVNVHRKYGGANRREEVFSTINQAVLRDFLFRRGRKRERGREAQPKAVFPRRSFASGHTQFPFFKGANAGVGRWKLDETKYAADAALISFFSHRQRGNHPPPSRLLSFFHRAYPPNLRVNVRRLCLCTSSGLTQLQKFLPPLWNN